MKSLNWYCNNLYFVLSDVEVHDVRDYSIVRVEAVESHAANGVCINGHVLISRGCPRLEAELASLGYEVATLEMSEFRKMDGGLSCLSIRL